MNEEIIKPIEGELVKAGETITEEIREAGKRGGVFIGTLNIMAEPAKQYLTEPIASIYKSRYENKFKKPLAVFLFDAGLILLGALAAAAAIYFAFFFKAYEPVKLSFSILPNDPVSGGEIIIKADVQNNTADTVSVDVPLSLPKTISIKSSSVPYDRTAKSLHFDAIEPGASSEARLTADLSGSIGQKQKVSGTLSYTNTRTNEKGRSAASATFTVSRSLVSLSFEMPEQIIVGQKFSGKIRYANKGGKDATNLYLTVNWPAGFVLATSDVAAGDGRFVVGTIKAGAEGTLGWSGTLTDPSSGTDFNAELDAKAGNEYIEQATATGTAGITDPKISVIISGAGSGRPNDAIPYTIEYKNNGDQTMSDVSLELVSTDGATADKIKGATTLAPGDDLKTTVQVRLPPSLPADRATQNNPTLGFSVAIKGKLGADNVTIASPAWNIKIASALGLTGTARYWSAEGDQLGRGPMPPRVGQTTRYWIFWNVTNTTNTVSGVTVSAVLPQTIEYTGKATVSTGDPIIFDPNSRTVTWNAGDVAPFPGSATDAVGAGFEVALTPVVAQAGSYPTLLTDEQITGTDAFSGLSLSASALDLSAKLINDNKALGTGPVR